MGLNRYEWFYQWSHPIGDHVFAHHDGAVSLCIGWDGLDCELLSREERASRFTVIYDLFRHFQPQYFYENHLWRETDDSILTAYLDMERHFVRAHEFGRFVRQEMANHLRQYAMSNSVGLVITLPMGWRPLTKRGWLKKQARQANALLEHALFLIGKLPGAFVCTAAQYAARIVQSLDRAAWRVNPEVHLRQDLLINEQLVREKPQFDADTWRLRVRDVYTKVFVVWLHPDANDASFLSRLACIACPMHITQIIQPVDRKPAVEAAERKADRDEGLMGSKGRTALSAGIDEQISFAEFVEEHDLPVYRTLLLVHLHGSKEQLDYYGNTVIEFFEGAGAGGQIRDAAYLQYPYFRVGQPGMGYQTSVLRPPDHLWQVANTAPVQTYRQGAVDQDGYPLAESVRLTSTYQATAFSNTNKVLASIITTAMSRGGKDMQAAIRTAELAPLGVDFGFMEFLPTHKWNIEALGGRYYTLDDTASVNPFPPYSLATGSGEEPLPSVIAGGTVQALAFLLTERMSLNTEEEACASLALQALYFGDTQTGDSPNLEDYRDSMAYLLEHDCYEGAEEDAARLMISKLSSLLKLPIGRRICQADTIEFDNGIIGFDLSKIGEHSPQLMKFFLVFISLRLAFAGMRTRNRSYVVLNDMSVFIKQFPEIIGPLCSQITKMGAKQNLFLWVITQETTDVDVIDKGIIRNIPIRDSLFRVTGHQELADHFRMPDGVVDVWRTFAYPAEFDYRQMIASEGDEFYDLYLTFPESLLAHGSSAPKDLDLKAQIDGRIKDPYDRIAQIIEARKRAPAKRPSTRATAKTREVPIEEEADCV